MNYPADDMLYDIEQKVRRNEACDDTVFLFEENNEMHSQYEELCYSIASHFNDFYFGKLSLMPDIAIETNKWLNDFGVTHETFEWDEKGTQHKNYSPIEDEMEYD